MFALGDLGAATRTTRKNRRTCGDSLWSERKTRKPLEGGGGCYEAET
ncbi:MAG: hypothetical protein F6J98_09760 [Moorea sp. SIO4G2]|nr:hypothetical protein [Moorena sp. SIO4G2]